MHEKDREAIRICADELVRLSGITYGPRISEPDRHVSLQKHRLIAERAIRASSTTWRLRLRRKLTAIAHAISE